MAVDVALDPDAVAAVVGRNVRSLRHERGWTLATLAARSGVSKGMVVQVEQARANASIATACRLATALGVGLARLLEVEAEPLLRVVAPGDSVRLWEGARGGWGDFLVGSQQPARTELWDWTIKPGESHVGQIHPEGSREMLYVLQGEVVLVLDGGLRSQLIEQAAALYAADRPHRIENAARKPAHLVMVLVEGAAS